MSYTKEAFAHSEPLKLTLNKKSYLHTHTHTQVRNYNKFCTFAKFLSRIAMIAIVAEQTRAAELDNPEPIQE